MLWVGTEGINPNEPCFNLSEVNLQTPEGGSWHRYQILSVVRKDRLAEYREDLGPREGFVSEEFRIPGGVWDPDTNRADIVHTVAELREMAKQTRAAGGFSSWLRTPLPTIDLVGGLDDHWEKLATISKEKGL